MDYKNEKIESLLKQLPKHMSDKFREIDNLTERILESSLIAYNELLDYKQKGLIEYYEEAGQQYYSPEPFKEKRRQFKKKFEEIKDFLYCHTKPPYYGVNDDGTAYILSEDEQEEHQKNDEVRFMIHNPNDIIKLLEQRVTHTGKDTTRKVLKIVTGLKRLTKQRPSEKVFGMPMLAAHSYEYNYEKV